MGSDTDSFTFHVVIKIDSFNTLKRNEIIFWRLMYRFIMNHDCIDIDNLCMFNHPLWRFNPDVDRRENLLEMKSRNRKRLGKFKSERPTPDQFIAKCVFLRAKLYCMVSVSDCQKKRCKGVNRDVVKEQMDFSDYENTVETGSLTYHSMTNFRTRKFEIFVESITKNSLSLICQKRFWYSRDVSYPYSYIKVLKCNYCFQKYTSTDRLSEHDLICTKNPFIRKDNDNDDQYAARIKNWLSMNTV